MIDYMASPPPPPAPRRSLSFKWRIGLKRTRTQSLTTKDDVKKTNDRVYYTGRGDFGDDNLGDYWRQTAEAYKGTDEGKEDYSVTQKLSQEQKDVIEKDNEYYIEDGDVVFLVQNTLFRVHKYFLTRESPVFKDMLSLPAPPGSDVEGSSDASPITLAGITSDDFANFLWIFYNPLLSQYDSTIKDWIGILRLAHMWECNNVRDLAFRELDKLPVPELERVLITRDYEGPQMWMDKATAALADRPEFLTEDEGRSLGVSLTIKILALREKRRNDVRCGTPFGPGARWGSRTSRSRSRSPPLIIPPYPVAPPQPNNAGPPIIIQQPPNPGGWGGGWGDHTAGGW